jgi:hypothetical protein
MSERQGDSKRAKTVEESGESRESRTLKVALAGQQLAEPADAAPADGSASGKVQLAQTFTLPDGRVLDVNQILNAIQSGADSIPIDGENSILIEDLLVALGLDSIEKLGDGDRVENTTASFTPGPLIQILQSLIEKGVIDPTFLNYGMLGLEEELVLAEDEGVDLSLLNWSIEGSSVLTEGGAPGIYTVSYTGVTLAPGQTVTISVATGGGFDGDTANDALAGSDYTALGTVLTFTGGGATGQTVAVSTIDDTVVEGDEDYTVTLTAAGAGTIVTSQSNTVIGDDNDGSLLTWSITGDSTVAEGGTAAYTVSYAGATLAPGQTVTISVATGGGFDGDTANDALAGSDYTALGTVLTFTGGGATGQTVAVSTIDDTVVEGDEDYTVTLTAAGAGTIVTSQANTVIGDDNDGSLLTWSITGDSTVAEGGTAAYTVSYAGATLAPGQTVTISVATGGGFDGDTANDALAGSDYTALSTVLTFTGGGATGQTVAVSTIDDTVVEGDEDYTVTLTDAGAGTIVTSQSNTVIGDDNDGSLLTWSITGDSTVAEGGTAAYTVSYAGATLAPGQTVTISVATGGGFDGDTANDALAGSDYTALGTVLTFTGGGATGQTVAVSTIDDTVVEGDEDYTVTLTAAGAGTIVTSQANTVIGDDNDGSLLTWSITGDSTVAEGGTAAYTVSYAGATLAPGQTVTISVATGGGFDGDTANDALAGSDYTALGTVLTFTGGGATGQTVEVSTIDDTVVEGDEDYTVTLTNAGAGSIVTSQANTVIGLDDNDASLLNWTIASGDSTVVEGGTASYMVSYTGATLAPGQEVTISVATGGGFDTNLDDAEAGTDYTTLGTILTFTGGGATQQAVQVSTVDDTVVEGDEDYTVTLTNAGAGFDRDEPGEHGDRRQRRLAAELDDRRRFDGRGGRHGFVHGVVHGCDAGAGSGSDDLGGDGRRVRRRHGERRAGGLGLHGAGDGADLHRRRCDAAGGSGVDG